MDDPSLTILTRPQLAQLAIHVNQSSIDIEYACKNPQPDYSKLGFPVWVQASCVNSTLKLNLISPAEVFEGKQFV